MLKWIRRLVLLAILAAVVARVLKSTKGEGGVVGREAFPSIGGDTWPPVPLNPDRRD